MEITRIASGCWGKKQAEWAPWKTQYWNFPRGSSTHVQEHPAGGYAGNRAMTGFPSWITPIFSTPEECALYLTFMENSQGEPK